MLDKPMCKSDIVKIDYSKPINAHKLCILVKLREMEQLVFECLNDLEKEDKANLKTKTRKITEISESILPALETWNCCNDIS